MALLPFSWFVLALIAHARYIVPGGRWRDTDGNLANAHAGCVIRDNSKFWWFGEYKTEGQVEGGGVSVYSSDDLATWESHGIALGRHHIYSVDLLSTPLATCSISNISYVPRAHRRAPVHLS